MLYMFVSSKLVSNFMNNIDVLNGVIVMDLNVVVLVLLVLPEDLVAGERNCNK